jgi:hypothetical protein
MSARTDIGGPDRLPRRPAFICPQCGKDTAILDQGYCPPCAEANQRELDQHNAQHDHWSGLTDAQRDAEIRRSM